MHKIFIVTFLLIVNINVNAEHPRFPDYAEKRPTILRNGTIPFVTIPTNDDIAAVLILLNATYSTSP